MGYSSIDDEFEQKLQAARLEVDAIFQKYDLMGFAALTAPTGSTFTHFMETKWSHMRRDGNKIICEVDAKTPEEKKAALSLIVDLLGMHLQNLTHAQRTILGMWTELGLMLSPTFREDIMAKFGAEEEEETNEGT